jgi:uncharacterized membrane protein (UPF0127 family)
MIKVDLELADTQLKRAQGLMGRKELGPNSGMAFIFPRKSRQSFWMQNTYIPLDIAFLNDDGSIFQIEQMYPHSTRFTSSDKPCKFAIEMNEGWFEKNNIGIGFKFFKEENWPTLLKVNSSYSFSSNIKIAQVEIENEEIEIEPNDLEGDLTPEQEMDFFGEEQAPKTEQIDYQQVPEQNQVVEYNMNQAAKIKYAEQNNLQLDIVYWTLSGKILPPRRLTPVPGEGYPIKSGPNGRYFCGYDSSPTIQGSGWEISGGIPKNFLVDNIISLDIVVEEGESGSGVEQTIEQPQNLWDRLKGLVNR